MAVTKPFKPTKQQLVEAAGKKVPDVIAPNLKVLFCGINPGLYTAAVGHHFARPGNRFWPALFKSGFTDRLVSPFEERELLASRNRNQQRRTACDSHCRRTDQRRFHCRRTRVSREGKTISSAGRGDSRRRRIPRRVRETQSADRRAAGKNSRRARLGLAKSQRLECELSIA